MKTKTTTRFPLFIASHLGESFGLGSNYDKSVIVFRNKDFDLFIEPYLDGESGKLYLDKKEEGDLEGDMLIKHKKMAHEEFQVVKSKAGMKGETKRFNYVCTIDALDSIIVVDSKVERQIDFVCFDEEDKEAKKKIESYVKEMATILRPVLVLVDYTTAPGSVVVTNCLRLILRLYKEDIKEISRKVCLTGGFYWSKKIITNSFMEEAGIDICELYMLSQESIDELKDIYEDTKEGLREELVIFKKRVAFFTKAYKLIFDYQLYRKKSAVTKALSRVKRHLLG